MTCKRDQEKRSAIHRLLESGPELAGSVTSTLTSLVIGGAEGQLLGSTAGPVLSWSLSELMQRRLSHSEKERVVDALQVAADRLQEFLDDGESLRKDGFFDTETNDRSAAEEIIEGVMLAAQREHEEKKVPYLGHLYATLAVTAGINRSYANTLLRHASELSYTQVRLLALLQERSRWNLRNRNFVGIHGRVGGMDVPVDLWDVLYETWDLWQRGLVEHTHDGDERYTPPNPFNVTPACMTVFMSGTILFDLMGLERIPQSELQQIIETLQWDGDLESTDRPASLGTQATAPRERS